MSMIAGILHLDDRPADADRMRRVLSAFAEYGPDGLNVRSEDHATLGHLMRFGTPESLHEILPAADRERGTVITAEARIDNREELFETLEIPHPERADIPDSTLILNAYRRWEAACPEHLEGDFAFGIYDRHAGLVFCAQSPYPTIPLYYIHTPDCFAFGTMIRPLLGLTGLPKRLNAQMLTGICASADLDSDRARSPSDETMFEGVLSLPPGTSMTIQRNGSARQHTYWRPEPDRLPSMPDDETYYDATRHTFIRAVHDRLRSRQPVASLLSGGLDSSSIACVAARRLSGNGARLPALSSVLPEDHKGDESDERKYIDIVRTAENIDWIGVHPRHGFLDGLTRIINATEHPAIAHKHYVYSSLMEVASERGVGVLLDGIGGDINLSNHAAGFHAWLARTGQWRLLARELRALATYARQPLLRLLFTQVLMPYAPRLRYLHHRIIKKSLHTGVVKIPVQPEAAARYRLNTAYRTPGAPPLMKWPSPRQDMMNAAAICQYAGLGMNRAFGIRTGFPFLDRRVTDLFLSTPVRLYTVNGWSRNLLRRTMAGILPAEIQWRRTKGPFSPDYYRRFLTSRSALREELAGIPTDAAIHDYVDMTAVLHQLDTLPDTIQHETSVAGLTVKLCVQTPMAVNRFLDWFDRTEIPGNG